MAPTFVFAIAGQLLGKLSSPIFEELGLAWGFRDDLKRLENTVSSVHAVLLDAQERHENNHQLKVWLGKLEDALYCAKDVIEEFEIDAFRYKISRQSILEKVRREFTLSNRIIFQFKMAHKIKKIRGEFDEISADRIKFNLIEGRDETVIVHREMTHSFVRDEDVIGRDYDKEAVINLLMNTTTDGNMSVIPIVGLGGIGKTTLAKFVYNDERVVNHFKLRFWVCFPEEFELEKIIKVILKSFKITDSNDLELEQLQQCLREKLDNQRYLLIFDDVWNENRAKWMKLRELLTCCARGSKIIITTRNQSVASIMGTSDHRINVLRLSHGACLSLFMKWAFEKSQDATTHPHLIEIAESIVEKCKGVPLAVITVGSLLYSKRDEWEWIKVRDNEIWKIKQKEGDILPVLKLSYNQLPTNLRRCFAFCSIFPKDYLFFSQKLIWSWKANGLLDQSSDNQYPENIGMTYIKQLLSRGLFQDFHDHGVYTTFKLHDFVHDLALLVAGREFVHINSGEIQDCLSTRMVRHISFPKDYFREKDIPHWLMEQKGNLHTFSFPNGTGASRASFVEACISKFKSLRLLDLSDSRFEVLPTTIGNLKHLKFLHLKGNPKLKSLPASICKLVGLEILDFTGCINIEKLPRGIRKLIKLKSLAITTKETHLPENEIRCLTSLQYLTIRDCPNLKFVMSDDAMRCLTALRWLIIGQCENLVPAIGLRHLTRLEFLSIWDCMTDYHSNSGETENAQGEEGLHNLQTLFVCRLMKIEILPMWLLHGAHNMQVIYIDRCYNLTNLIPEWMLESLKLLQSLGISDCPKLESLPEKLCCLIALRKIWISGCPKLVSRCQRENGEDWHKIWHVPNIYLDGIKI